MTILEVGLLSTTRDWAFYDNFQAFSCHCTPSLTICCCHRRSVIILKIVKEGQISFRVGIEGVLHKKTQLLVVVAS